MKRLVVLATLALAAPVSAATSGHGSHDSAPGASVAIGYSTYTPANVIVVAGERVRFSNDSARAHTVTADDDSFDSGRIPAGEMFDLDTATPGTVSFHCSLHPGITGSVDVRTLLLSQPSAAANAGRAFPLRGRTSLAPRTELTIQADSGEGFRDAATTTVGADGSFDAQLTPSTTATYRAVAGENVSNAVRLVVLDRKVSLQLRRNRGRDTLTATVTPPSPGAHVVLQLYLPDRFGWWPVQRARLDKHSRARFTLRARRRLAARVRLTLPDGATLLAQSNTVRVGAPRAPHAH
jgi:plastocyanin